MAILGYENSPWEFGIEMTHCDKFGDLKIYLARLGTRMTQVYESKNIFWKFRDLDDTLRQVRGLPMYFTVWTK